MSLSFFIAKRYFRSHRRRGFLSFITTIAILGVMLGTAALIITLSILDGFEREIKEKVVGFTSHIVVQGYQNVVLPGSRRSLERVQRSVPGVRAIAPFAAKEGMIRSKGAVDGIYLKGIDPEHDILSPRRHIVKGAFLHTPADTQREPQLVIGNKLAVRLDVGVGDHVAVFALPAGSESGPPRAMRFRIEGIYESGMAEYDDIFAYTGLDDARRLFRMAADDVTGYDILVTDLDRIDATAKAVEAVLGYPHYARTVFELYRNLFSWVELQKKLSPLLLSLIIVVATVNMIGTLLMFVLEKTRAIGILKSLGAGGLLIGRIFLLQGLAIAAIGIALGNLLAFAFCWVQQNFRIISLPADIYYMNTVPVLITPGNFLMVTAAAFVLCLVTSLVPSRAAAKLNPLTAFRFG